MTNAAAAPNHSLSTALLAADLDAPRLSPLGRRLATGAPCDMCGGGGKLVEDSGTYATPDRWNRHRAFDCNGCGGSGVDHTADAEALAATIFADPDADHALTGREAWESCWCADDLPGEDAREAFCDAWDALAAKAAERVAVRGAA